MGLLAGDNIEDNTGLTRSGVKKFCRRFQCKKYASASMNNFSSGVNIFI